MKLKSGMIMSTLGSNGKYLHICHIVSHWDHESKEMEDWCYGATCKVSCVVPSKKGISFCWLCGTLWNCIVKALHARKPMLINKHACITMIIKPELFLIYLVLYQVNLVLFHKNLNKHKTSTVGGELEHALRPDARFPHARRLTAAEAKSAEPMRISFEN